MMPVETSKTTARRACRPCRRRKRKCNRDLQGCSRCERLGCRCVYDSRRGAARHDAQTKYEKGDETHVSLSMTRDSPFNPSRLDGYQEDPLLTDALGILGSADNVHKHAARYFSSIQAWLPVVSRVRFFGAITRRTDEWGVTTSWVLLACTMYLLTQVTHDAATGQMSEVLYRRVKRLLLVSELDLEPCLDLVQARLLLAVYELGHGLESAAYLSIGACARMAIVMGLDRSQDVEYETLQEEKRRVWWGIVITERYINLAFPGRPLITGDPDLQAFLPLDDGIWDSRDAHSEVAVPMTTSSHARAGPFAREAQMACLLGRTITNVFNPTPDSEFNVGESRQLEKTLASFISILPVEDEAKPCSGYCGAMGMCSSALMLLHTKGPADTHKGELRYPQTALQYSAFAVKRANKYTTGIATVDIDSLPPFTPYAIYQAYLIEHSRLDPVDAEQFRAITSRLDALECMLASFGRRWRTASMNTANILPMTTLTT